MPGNFVEQLLFGMLETWRLHLPGERDGFIGPAQFCQNEGAVQIEYFRL